MVEAPASIVRVRHLVRGCTPELQGPGYQGSWSSGGSSPPLSTMRLEEIEKKCPACDHVHDVWDPQNGPLDTPTEGAILVCSKCGEILTLVGSALIVAPRSALAGVNFRDRREILAWSANVKARARAN